MGDVFMFRYCGINVFLKVSETYGNTATVYELETYKYKDTNKFFDKWKKDNPDKKVSRTGWAEVLKTTRRAKKPINCVLAPMSATNSLRKPSLTFKTGYAKGAPTLIIPINRKTRLYWLAKDPNEGYMMAKPIIRYGDKHADKRKQLFVFYTYIKPENKSSGIVEA